MAIAIPTFTGQLEKARDSASIANLRSAYAEAQAAYLTGDNGGDTNITITKSGSTITSIAVANVAIESGNGSDNWSGYGADLPFAAPTDPGSKGKYTLTFTYENNAIKEVSLAAMPAASTGA